MLALYVYRDRGYWSCALATMVWFSTLLWQPLCIEWFASRLLVLAGLQVSYLAYQYQPMHGYQLLPNMSVWPAANNLIPNALDVLATTLSWGVGCCWCLGGLVWFYCRPVLSFGVLTATSWGFGLWTALCLLDNTLSIMEKFALFHDQFQGILCWDLASFLLQFCAGTGLMPWSLANVSLRLPRLLMWNQ